MDDDSPPYWQDHIWPCYSCCTQIWIPKDATFGEGCPGIIAYIPIWVALLVFLGRYSLIPIWRRRPIWLRIFATEDEEFASRKRPDSGDAEDFADDDNANNADVDDVLEAAVDDPDSSDIPGLDAATAAATADAVSDNGSESSTVVGFGRRRNSLANARPVNTGGFPFVKIQSWHLMTITLFLLSLSGVITSLTLTFAGQMGFLYLTPIVPCFVVSLILAIDRPRTLPGAVFIIYGVTLAVQLGLLFGVPALSSWPQNLTWLAEMSVPLLALVIMLAMPMRDPWWGNGSRTAGNAISAGTTFEKIAAPFETPANTRRSPEDNTTLWRWANVSWMAPLIGLGATRQLNDEDVWSLPFQFQHARLYRMFHDVKGSVTARVVKVNAPDLIITSVLGILQSLLSLLPIVLLKQLLAALDGNNPRVRVAIIYAVLICITNLTRAQCDVLSLWFSRRCYERSRGELITMIYEKTLRRKAFTIPSHSKAVTGKGKAASGPASTGKILNLMRNDVYEVAQRFWEFPTLFTKPLNFVLSIFLLWNVLGAASLFGIIVVVLAQVLNIFVVRALVRWETARRAITDVKLQVTSQFIESIRHLRWYDWQDKWLGDIMTSREKELRYRVVTNLIQKCIAVINQIAASFFPVVAFYAYTVVENKPLTVDIAFPALNLFDLLEQSLRELPDLITVLLNANVAMHRIDEFMSEPDKAGEEDNSTSEAPNGLQRVFSNAIAQPLGQLRVEINDASFAWPGAPTTVLSKVDFTAEGGGLTIICGKVGTGKTALLMSIMGELDQKSGSRSVPREAIGYCSQTPWLQSMTIRENILFFTPLDEDRYNRTVEACCLLPDFAEFEAGDQSSIGENGIGLSGGQKARVALARAVYSQSRILLLDDPIAALDHNTGETIMKRLFGSSDLMQDRLVVFVTHRMDLVASYADQIYEVSNESGIVSRLDVDEVRRTFEEDAALTVEGEGSGQNNGNASPGDSSDSDGPELEAATKNNNAPNKFIEEEHRAHGGVMLSIYWRYVKAGGLRWWFLVLVFFVGFRASKLGYLYFLKIWGEAYNREALAAARLAIRAAAQSTLRAVETAQGIVASWHPYSQILAATTQGHEELSNMGSLSHAVLTSNEPGWFQRHVHLPSPEVNVKPWLFWFAAMQLTGVFSRTVADLLLIVITYTAGRKVFQDVMNCISTATFRFFDVTPVGRLMNRVTSDIGTIDGAIAMQIHRCAWCALMWVSCITVIGTATPTFLVLAVFMTCGFVFTFFRFLPASQSLRRLEMVSLSPLMTNFGTLLEGLTTVRAFRAQPHFQERIITTTDAFQRMDHFYWSLQAWLQWRFSALTAASTLALTLTALATGLSSGLVAFVLTAASNFVSATQVLCRRYGELQMQFVSVERVIELLDLEKEPVGDIDPPAAWPTANDDIVFDNVTVRYAPQLEPSLREISMRIPAGSTVAVTGRTGSGKSTLALVLLGTVLADNDETTHGSLHIGGLDVARVNKHALRQRISFVAQDPVLFPGTLRQNLDPIGEHTDAECELVLKRVLSDATGDFSLTSRVDGGGKNMSQGQRQLIGLGRAVLRRSPIVILDEATASIDKKTAFRIQEVLRAELRQSTVITIAHRLEAVSDADFSVVLENGRVIHAGPVEPSTSSEHGTDESTATTQVDGHEDGPSETRSDTDSHN